MNRLTLVGLVVVVLGHAGSVEAHHTTPAPRSVSPAPTATQTQVQFDMSSTAFDLEGVEGQFWTFAITGQLQLGRVGLRMRAPVHTLHITDEPHDSGLGDVSVGANISWNGELGYTAWLILAGLDVSLPAGDSARGLGQGTSALVPFAAAVWSLSSEWQLLGLVSGAFNTDPRHAETPTFVQHRSDMEGRAALGAAWQHERVRASAQLFAVLPFAPQESRGRFYPTVGPTAAVEVANDTWIAGYAEFPAAPTRQFDWQAGLAVVVQWNAKTDTALIAPTFLSTNTYGEKR